ncbi:metal ABC transporter permease, partial [Bacillus sp. D-CC]
LQFHQIKWRRKLFVYLFGSVSAVTSTDLIIIGIVAIVVIVTITLLYKELFLLSFDEEYAVSTGLSAKWIHFIFIILVALVIAVSMRVVGVLLVSSLMTLPVAASIRIANGFKQTIFFFHKIAPIKIRTAIITIVP